MKIVLLLSGRDALPKGLFEAACALNEEQPILLIGVFLPKESYLDTLWYYSGGVKGMLFGYDSFKEPVVIADEAIGQFKSLCLKNGIEYRIHEKDERHISEGLKRETRFADLLLLSNEALTKASDDHLGQLREYTDDTLHYSECPILIIPKDYQQLRNVILAYDGNAGSVFAIKQFVAFMPDMTSLKMLLINGSFGRTEISRALKSTFADDVLKAHEMTVFIAHK